MTELSHGNLVLIAEKWLKSNGFNVVIRDPFRCYTQEQPDAIGWRSNVSALIEVKASRSDFLADKKKPFRALPKLGMGDWRFYLCQPEIIQPEDLPEGWGLLWFTGKNIRKIHGVPKGNTSWGAPPHHAEKRYETMMLVSALRRLQISGHFDDIYISVSDRRSKMQAEYRDSQDQTSFIENNRNAG